jgi:hypothetical protein
LKLLLAAADLAKSILGAHLLHDIGRWPNLLAGLPHSSHAVIKFLLVSAVSLDLSS